MQRHPLDAVSLVFGLLFAALGLGVLIDAATIWRLGLDRWWPLALMAAGLWLLLSARSNRTQNEPTDEI